MIADDWTHWIFVGFLGLIVLLIVMGCVFGWTYGRRTAYRAYGPITPIKILNDHEDENTPYDWEMVEPWA